MLAGIVQIEEHLSSIGVRELGKFQIYDDQALKPAVEENQINPIPFGSYAQAVLPSNKREVITRFQQALFETLKSAFSSSVSEYSTFKFKNSRTNGFLTCASATLRHGFSDR